MPVGTQAPQGANRYGESQVDQNLRQCVLLGDIGSGCRGNGFKFTARGSKIKGYCQECCEYGSSTRPNTSVDSSTEVSG